jgi:pimeloyl-ACP methyl ester carboxylesterase
VVNQSGVVCAVAISSDLPYKDLPPSEFSSFLKDFHFLTKYMPFLLRFFMNSELHKTVFSKPERYTQSILRDESTLYEHEGEELKTYISSCVNFLREGMNAYGIEEPFREIKMEREDWRFTLETITNVPIVFWHGTRNKLIPVRLVRKVAESMRDKGSIVELHEVTRKGHYFWMNDDKWRDVLANMLQYFPVND